MITVCGTLTTLDDLRNITIGTPPRAGSRWRPVAHADLVDVLLDECTLRGWGVLDQKYAVARQGAEMAGALGVQIKGTDGASLDLPDGITMGLGFANSNSRRACLRLTMGATVACCTNGMVTGNILLKKKHEGSFDLVDTVADALDQYALSARAVPASIAALRSTTISPAQAADVLMEAGRRKLVGWSAIGRVDAEYNRPTFAEHGKGTSWALLQAFTFAARDNISPVRQMDTYRKFMELLPSSMATAA